MVVQLSSSLQPFLRLWAVKPGSQLPLVLVLLLSGTRVPDSTPF